MKDLRDKVAVVTGGANGIGLALVRLVSAQLGGSVAVADGPAGGAVFTVRLPQSGHVVRLATAAGRATDA